MSSEGADLHIVLGSSLRVRPACMMPIATADKGGNLVSNIVPFKQSSMIKQKIFRFENIVVLKIQ